jgi:hypothetical protein
MPERGSIVRAGQSACGPDVVRISRSQGAAATGYWQPSGTTTHAFTTVRVTVIAKLIDDPQAVDSGGNITGLCATLAW